MSWCIFYIVHNTWIFTSHCINECFFNTWLIIRLIVTWIRDLFFINCLIRTFGYTNFFIQFQLYLFRVVLSRSWCFFYSMIYLTSRTFANHVTKTFVSYTKAKSIITRSRAIILPFKYFSRCLWKRKCWSSCIIHSK